MKLLVDSADINEIERLYEYYPIDGVTTNPTILASLGREPFYVLKEIRKFIDDAELHVQSVASTADGIIRDAERIVYEIGRDTYIKVPAVMEGFKAMKALASMGYKVTATAVYTPMQAYLAAKCGALYTAAYVNRIDNLGYDGVEEVKRMQDIYENNGFTTSILAASFKNTRQVLALCEYGIGAATLSPSVMEGLVKNREIESAVDNFKEDFEGRYGIGKTMETL